MDDLRKAYRTVSIIGLGMIASVFVYALVVELLPKDPMPSGAPAPPDETVNTIKFVLLGVSGVLFFVIRIVNAHFLSPPANRSGVSAARGTQAGLSPELQRFVTAAVIAFALVLFFIGHNRTDFYLFLLISLLFFAVHFPKYSQWEEWYRQQRR